MQGFGSGSAFEGAITVRLKDTASGAVLASVNTQVVQADRWRGLPVPGHAHLYAAYVAYARDDRGDHPLAARRRGDLCWPAGR